MPGIACRVASALLGAPLQQGSPLPAHALTAAYTPTATAFPVRIGDSRGLALQYPGNRRALNLGGFGSPRQVAPRPLSSSSFSPTTKSRLAATAASSEEAFSPGPRAAPAAASTSPPDPHRPNTVTPQEGRQCNPHNLLLVDFHSLLISEGGLTAPAPAKAHAATAQGTNGRGTAGAPDPTAPGPKQLQAVSRVLSRVADAVESVCPGVVVLLGQAPGPTWRHLLLTWLQQLLTSSASGSETSALAASAEDQLQQQQQQRRMAEADAPVLEGRLGLAAVAAEAALMLAERASEPIAGGDASRVKFASELPAATAPSTAASDGTASRSAAAALLSLLPLPVASPLSSASTAGATPAGDAVLGGSMAAAALVDELVSELESRAGLPVVRCPGLSAGCLVGLLVAARRDATLAAASAAAPAQALGQDGMPGSPPDAVQVAVVHVLSDDVRLMPLVGTWGAAGGSGLGAAVAGGSMGPQAARSTWDERQGGSPQGADTAGTNGGPGSVLGGEQRVPGAVEVRWCGGLSAVVGRKGTTAGKRGSKASTPEAKDIAQQQPQQPQDLTLTIHASLRPSLRPPQPLPQHLLPDFWATRGSHDLHLPGAPDFGPARSYNLVRHLAAAGIRLGAFGATPRAVLDSLYGRWHQGEGELKEAAGLLHRLVEHGGYLEAMFGAVVGRALGDPGGAALEAGQQQALLRAAAAVSLGRDWAVTAAAGGGGGGQGPISGARLGGAAVVLDPWQAIVACGSVGHGDGDGADGLAQRLRSLAAEWGGAGVAAAKQGSAAAKRARAAASPRGSLPSAGQAGSAAEVAPAPYQSGGSMAEHIHGTHTSNGGATGAVKALEDVVGANADGAGAAGRGGGSAAVPEPPGGGGDGGVQQGPSQGDYLEDLPLLQRLQDGRRLRRQQQLQQPPTRPPPLPPLTDRQLLQQRRERLEAERLRTSYDRSPSPLDLGQVAASGVVPSGSSHLSTPEPPLPPPPSPQQHPPPQTAYDQGPYTSRQEHPATAQPTPPPPPPPYGNPTSQPPPSYYGASVSPPPLGRRPVSGVPAYGSVPPFGHSPLPRGPPPRTLREQQARAASQQQQQPPPLSVSPPPAGQQGGHSTLAPGTWQQQQQQLQRTYPYHAPSTPAQPSSGAPQPTGPQHPPARDPYSAPPSYGSPPPAGYPPYGGAAPAPYQQQPSSTPPPPVTPPPRQQAQQGSAPHQPAGTVQYGQGGPPDVGPSSQPPPYDGQPAGPVQQQSYGQQHGYTAPAGMQQGSAATPSYAFPYPYSTPGTANVEGSQHPQQYPQQFSHHPHPQQQHQYKQQQQRQQQQQHGYGQQQRSAPQPWGNSGTLPGGEQLLQGRSSFPGRSAAPGWQPQQQQQQQSQYPPSPQQAPYPPQQQNAASASLAPVHSSQQAPPLQLPVELPPHVPPPEPTPPPLAAPCWPFTPPPPPVPSAPPLPSWIQRLEPPLGLGRTHHDTPKAQDAAAAAASAAESAAAAQSPDLASLASFTQLPRSYGCLGLHQLQELVSYLCRTLNDGCPVFMHWELPPRTNRRVSAAASRARQASTSSRKGGKARAAAAWVSDDEAATDGDAEGEAGAGAAGGGLAAAGPQAEWLQEAGRPVGLTIAWPAVDAVRQGAEKHVALMHAVHLELEQQEREAEGEGAAHLEPLWPPADTQAEGGAVEGGGDDGSRLTASAAARALVPLLRPVPSTSNEGSSSGGSSSSWRWVVVTHNLKRFVRQCAACGVHVAVPPAGAHLDTLAAALVMDSSVAMELKPQDRKALAGRDPTVSDEKPPDGALHDSAAGLAGDNKYVLHTLDRTARMLGVQSYGALVGGRLVAAEMQARAAAAAAAGGDEANARKVQQEGVQLPPGPDCVDGRRVRATGEALLNALAYGELQRRLCDPREGQQALLIREVEVPVQVVLAHMELAGLQVDLAGLRRLHPTIMQKMAELQRQADAIVEHHERQQQQQPGRLVQVDLEVKAPSRRSYDIRTVGGKRDLLYQVMRLQDFVPPGLHGKLLTEKGDWSTGQEAVSLLREYDPSGITGVLAEYAQLSHLATSYVEKFVGATHEASSRLYPSVEQGGTRTGRLAMTGANLMALPNATRDSHPLVRDFRRCLTAAPGCVLLAADYSQIELRLLAHITGDPTMTAAFTEGRDVHTETARLLFNRPDITPEQRQIGKQTNFGIVYGMGPGLLAAQAKIPLDEARGHIRTFELSYPQAMEHINAVRAGAVVYGRVRSIWGRTRHFRGLWEAGRSLAHYESRSVTAEQLAPADRSGSRQQLVSELGGLIRSMRAGAVGAAQRVSTRDDTTLREAGNMAFQGSSSDVVKLAMVRTVAALRGAGIRGRLLSMVHDELVFEVEAGDAERAAGVVQAAMEAAGRLGRNAIGVQLKVEAEMGPNMQDLAEWAGRQEEGQEQGQGQRQGP